jgi:hypothetical protein
MPQSRKESDGLCERSLELQITCWTGGPRTLLPDTRLVLVQAFLSGTLPALSQASLSLFLSLSLSLFAFCFVGRPVALARQTGWAGARQSSPIRRKFCSFPRDPRRILAPWSDPCS